MRRRYLSLNEAIRKNLKRSLKEAAAYRGNDTDSVVARLNDLSANLKDAYDSMQLNIENGKERIGRVISEFEREFGEYITGVKRTFFDGGVLYMTYGTGMGSSEYNDDDEESRFGILDGATYEYGDGVNYSANTYIGKDGEIELELELVVLNDKKMSRGMVELLNSLDDGLGLSPQKDYD